MRLFLFELKKILRQRKLLLLLGIVILAVLAVTIQSKLYAGASQKQALEDIKIYQNESQLLIKQYEEDLHTRGHEEKFQAGYTNAKEMHRFLMEWEQAILSSKWERIPTIEADFWKTIHYHQSLGGIFNFIGNMEHTLQLQQEKNKLLLEYHLPYEDERYSFTLPIFLFNSSSIILSFPFILLLLILFGDIITSEYEQRTNRLLHTQPFYYPKIIVAKFMTILSIIALTIISFVGFATIASLLFSEPASIWKYPIQIGTSIHDMQLVPVYRTVGQLFSFTISSFLSVTVFLFACHFVISQLIQSRLATLCTSVVLFTTSYIITINVDMLKTMWNPFYYLHIAQLVKNSEAFTSQWQLLPLWGYSFLLLSLCYLLEKRHRSLQQNSYVAPFKDKGFHSIFFNVLQFEWRKLWRLGIIKQLAILLSALFLGGYFFLAFLTMQKEQDVLHSLEVSKAELSSHLIPLYQDELAIQQRVLKQLASKETLTDEEQFAKEMAEAMLKPMTHMLEEAHHRFEQLDGVLQAYEEENWTAFYDYWIKQNELWGNLDGNTSYINNFATEQGGLSHFTFVASIEQKKRLAQLHIAPTFAIEYLNTYYDQFIETKDQVEWSLETQQIEHTALFYCYLFFETYGYLFLLLLLLFVFGTGWLGELRNNKTISLLKTQPIPSSTLFLGKFTLQNILAVFFTLFSFSIIIIVSTLINRFGDWAFPLLKYGLNETGEGFSAFEGDFHFITMGNYLLQSITLFIFAIFFIITFASFVASFWRNNTLAVSVLFILFIFGYVGSMSLNLAHLSPFTYLNIPKVLNGELKLMLENPLISFENGLLAFAMSTVLLFAVTYFVRKKKGIPKAM